MPLQVLASLDAAAVPLLQGAGECAAAGHLSSLHAENARVAAVVQGGAPLEGSAAAATFALLVDPQTSGGLLAAVPADAAERCVAELREAGFVSAAVVGRVAGVLDGEDAPCLQLHGLSH